MRLRPSASKLYRYNFKAAQNNVTQYDFMLYNFKHHIFNHLALYLKYL